jgi:DNA-binding response OmpR family regulator
MRANKILFIEDEKILAQMYKDKLEEAGFSTILAFSAEEALDLLQKEKVDLIILDILLPKKDGIDFLEEFKKNSENLKIPVVALSNYDDPEAKKKAFALGIKDYLLKTEYTPQELISKIQEYLS